MIPRLFFYAFWKLVHPTLSNIYQHLRKIQHNILSFRMRATITQRRLPLITKAERANWIVNIENTASFIESEIGTETVDFVLEKHGAKTVEQIVLSDLSGVFSELYAIEADLRSG